MNFDVLILFFNATLVTILSCIAVIWILRKQYLPIIREEEEKQRNSKANAETEKTNNPEIKQKGDDL